MTKNYVIDGCVYKYVRWSVEADSEQDAFLKVKYGDLNYSEKDGKLFVAEETLNLVNEKDVPDKEEHDE